MTPSVEDILLTLNAGHKKKLLDMLSLSCVFGWENYDDLLADLVEIELCKGKWMGNLEDSARPMWELTDLGRKVAETLKKL